MNAQWQTVLEKVQYLHGLKVPKTEIAKQLGVHRNTIAAWIEGKRTPFQDLNEKASGAQTPTGQDRQRMDVDAAINADSTTIPA